MKILLQGPLSTRSIEGRDLIGMAKALVSAGADVYVHPETRVTAPLPKVVAALLSKEPAPPDLLLSTVPDATYAAIDATRIWFGYGEDVHLPVHIGTTYHAAFYKSTGTGAALRANGFEGAGMTWTAGVDPLSFRYVQRDWFEAPTFLVLEKDRDLAFAAFDLLHATEPELMKREPKLAAVAYENLSPAELASVIKDFDVLLCTTGEPNIQQEFMASGGLVLARYDGVHPHWLNNDFSHRFYVREGTPPETGLAAQMMGILRNPEDCARKAGQASWMALEQSWTKVMDRFFLNLEDLVPEGKRLRADWLRLKPVKPDPKE